MPFPRPYFPCQANDWFCQSMPYSTFFKQMERISWNYTFSKYDRVQNCGWLPPFARCKSPKTASEGQPVQAWTRTTGVATCECSTQATLLGWISVVPLAHRWSSQTHKVSIIIIYTYYRNQHCRSGGWNVSIVHILPPLSFLFLLPFFFSVFPALFSHPTFLAFPSLF